MSTDILPSFLREEAQRMTKADASRLEPAMQSWLTVHAYIKTLDATPKDVSELCKMMVYELRTRRRLHVLVRLRSRFNNLRIRAEDREVLSTWRNVQ